MANLLQTVKSLGLSEFYFSLPVDFKSDLKKYSRYLSISPENIMSCSPDCQGCFMVTNGAQLLWATATNAIPDKKYEFAECLLKHGLTIAKESEDVAWIHANLAQLYYDRHKTDPDAGRRSISHCRELIKLGYMKSWAQNLMEEIMVFQVQ